MLLVVFARKSPRLHDEGGDGPGGEHRALLHLCDLDFSEWLCGGGHGNSAGGMRGTVDACVCGGDRCVFVSG
jgi:hypothetical protein